jgi:hypothetical protein
MLQRLTLRQNARKKALENKFEVQKKEERLETGGLTRGTRSVGFWLAAAIGRELETRRRYEGITVSALVAEGSKSGYCFKVYGSTEEREESRALYARVIARISRSNK